MADYLPDKITRLTADEVIDAFAVAYQRFFSKPIDAPTLAIITAKSALETGQWKSIHHFNLGNIKSRDPVTGLSTMFPCDERLSRPLAKASIAVAKPRLDDPAKPNAALKYVGKDGKWVVQFWPEHEQCRFRAYPDLASAAYEYLRFVATDTRPNDGKPSRFARAWHAADTLDDPALFVQELGKAGYFTADADVYMRAVVSLYKQFLPKCKAYLARDTDTRDTVPAPRQDAPTLPEIEAPIDSTHVLGLVALTLSEQARDYFSDGDEPDATA